MLIKRRIALVALDRDGVINHDSKSYIKKPDEWKAIRGSLEAIARLNAEGFSVCIVTNQSGVNRGLFDIPMLEAIHIKMQRELASLGGRIDRIFFCPHLPEAGCSCRKPRPGLLQQASESFGIPPTEIAVIGDSLKDVQVAAAVGALPILVRTGNGARTEESALLPREIIVLDDLNDAVEVLLNSRSAYFT